MLAPTAEAVAPALPGKRVHESIGRANRTREPRSCEDPTMMNHALSRRAMLRGIGVTMALPWLESLPVWGDEPRAGAPGAPASEAPVRLAVLFAGNGFHSREWWAT